MEYDAGNYLPGYTGDQPNVNTGFEVGPEGVTTKMLSGEAIPFNHFQRLADKLFGAVEMNIDAAIAESSYDADITQRVGSPNALVPQSVGAWLERNSAAVTLISVIASILGILAFVRK
jgi:hypothetical protein